MASREMLRRALAVIKTSADYEYFFAKLTSSTWLEPMLEEGLFGHPPAIIRADDRIAFPFWPESAYLVRVAGDEPNVAARVLDAVPLTDNDRVHEDLARAALHVGINSAARWASREAEWINGRDYLYWQLPEALAALAIRLANSGRVDGALALTRSLLAPQPDPSLKDHASDEESEWRFPPQPTPRFDRHDYGEIVEPLVEPLVRQGRARALELFADLLDQAVALSVNPEDRDGSADYSFIWRNDLGGSDVNGDVRDTLVEATRDAAILLLAAGEKCDDILRIIRAHNWDVMRRLDLYIIVEACLDNADLVRSRVFDQRAFRDVVLQHEYATLVRRAAPDLKAEEVLTLLQWIDAGPEVPPNDDDPQGSIERWQRDRLALLSPALPPEWTTRLDNLQRSHGPPLDDFRAYQNGGAYTRGLSSPKTSEELEGMSSYQLLSMLRTWQPGGDRDEPSVDGLASTIAGMASDSIARLTADAGEWLGVDAHYVASFLSAIQRTVLDDRSIAWAPVLELCAGVARSEDSAQGAVWARKAVADLIEKALRRGEASLPLAYRQKVWAIIENLLFSHVKRDDQEMTGGEDLDALTAALNSTHGKAAEAVVRYAIWVRLTTLGEGGSNVPLRSDLPEVDKALSALLDASQFRSPAIRGVFGVQLEALCWLDLAWVKSHLSELFPKNSDDSALREAVWSTYLRYGRPFLHALDIFRTEYEFAINHVRQQDAEGRSSSSRDVDARLGEHLMTYYWRGELTSNAGDLVDRYFATAAGDLRHRALEYVGRSLRETMDIKDETLASLRTLWDWRMAVGGKTRPSRATPEAEAFGWWFSSGKFENSWSLSRLAEALRIGDAVEPDHLVAERLVTLVDARPGEVADCLLLIVEKAPQGYSIMGWRDELSAMLHRLLGDTHADIVSRARMILNALAARGIREFQALGNKQ